MSGNLQLHNSSQRTGSAKRCQQLSMQHHLNPLAACVQLKCNALVKIHSQVRARCPQAQDLMPSQIPACQQRYIIFNDQIQLEHLVFA